MLWGVIMAGGSGDRFWPKSRQAFPKQLLPITDRKTMIQLTILRLKGLIDYKNILIITNSIQRSGMIKQLPMIPPQNIIAEPMKRDTAPCIGLAAVLIAMKDKDASMLILPADHVIKNKALFQKNIRDGIKYLEKNNCLMTFGIKPSFPSTGYGYIETGNKIISISKTDFYAAERFVEKPDYKTAEKYLKMKKYLWNSGMFAWKAQTILAEIKRQMPDLYDSLNKIKFLLSVKKNSLCSVLKKIYPQLEKKSIDYGIMENASHIVVSSALFDWDDIGSWESVGNHFRADENGNVCIGKAALINCKNLLVYNLSGNKRLLAGIVDMEDKIIVQTEDAVLVCPKSSAQKVKQLVEHLKAEKLEAYL